MAKNSRRIVNWKQLQLKSIGVRIAVYGVGMI